MSSHFFTRSLDEISLFHVDCLPSNQSTSALSRHWRRQRARMPQPAPQGIAASTSLPQSREETTEIMPLVGPSTLC